MPDILDLFDKPCISGFDDIENDVITYLIEQGDYETLLETNYECYLFL